MNADNTSLDSLSERVLDAVFEVSNTLGAGFLEKVYQRALLRELSLRGIQATAEASMAVVYKGHSVGEYFADLLVEDALVVEQNVPNALPASTPPSVSTICGLPAGPCAFSSISRSPKSSGSGSFLALPTGPRRRGITSRSIGLSSYLLDTTLVSNSHFVVDSYKMAGMRMSKVWVGLIALGASTLAAQTTATTPAAVGLLRTNCSPCHSERNRSSGLSMDNRAAILQGGNRGPAIKPGAPGESLLVQAIEQTGDLKIPPAGRLSAEQVSTIRAWIEQGMIWPELAQDQKRKGADHWAFQPPKAVSPPDVKTAGWTGNPIDRFVMAKLEKEGIRPSPEADRDTLLRRVSLDLTGLPPSPREIQDFRADQAPDAYEKVVSRLLASPHYGERWGRHWLDLARYADSDGFEKDTGRPYAWRYRNWVIESLNRDLPFDQFTVEQLAGDLLPNATTDQKVATGFHRNTLTNKEGGVDQEQFRVEQVVDRVNTTAKVFLGSTLGCSQCHDHKYDPLSQREFYQFFAFFNADRELDLDAALPGEAEKLKAQQVVFDAEKAKLQAAIDEAKAKK